MNRLPSLDPFRLGGHDLSVRLDALAELVRIGRACQAQAAAAHGEPLSQDGGTFDEQLLDTAETVLKRAGERLRLSGDHTVVALAGGTGSGKSTLFNALSGAAFSPDGVTRPVTREAHACVWGMRGAAPLLDWLGVDRRHRYARASVLDSGESDLDGLILLDLPDHDSVVSASMAAVDRLANLADMVIWVLDPQKYADAAVHDRYLLPLAGHAAVFTVVLNQIDTLRPGQAADCADDLRDLLDHEGLADTPIFPVSARTGAGLAELRALLMDTVMRGRTARMRIAADIDALLGGFAAYSGPQVAPEVAEAPEEEPPPAEEEEPKPPSLPPWELSEEDPEPAPSRPPWEDATLDGGARDVADQSASVPQAPAGRLADAFAQAAGLSMVAQDTTDARRAQAARLTGWPASRLLRKRRGQGRADTAVGAAQQSAIDNAVTAFADTIGADLPDIWADGLRGAARGNASLVPPALALAAQAAAARGRSRPPAWWRLVAVWQWLLMVLAVAGAGFAAAIGIARLTRHTHGLLG
jgi:GTP-binding protein EngB required for normal cell division